MVSAATVAIYADASPWRPWARESRGAPRGDGNPPELVAAAAATTAGGQHQQHRGGEEEQRNDAGDAHAGSTQNSTNRFCLGSDRGSHLVTRASNSGPDPPAFHAQRNQPARLPHRLIRGENVTSVGRRSYVRWYSGPEPPSGGVRRPPFAVIAPHWTQFDGVTCTSTVPTSDPTSPVS